MTVFAYTGRNRAGAAVSGTLECASTEAAAVQLAGNDITPIDIEETGIERGLAGPMEKLRLRLKEGTVGLTEQVFLCRQMYTLLKAGVPIMDAIKGLRDTTPNLALMRILADIVVTLDGGQDLTTALRRHAQVFSTLFISLVQVGETTGNLAEVFQRLSFYLEREKDTRDRLKQAMRYPKMVFAAIGVAIMIINLYVIPAFASVFENLGAELPWATRLLMTTSQFTVNYWYVVLGGLAALVFAVNGYIATPVGRHHWDRYKLKLPVVGKVFYEAALARFGRSIAIALKAGVPLTQAMNIVGHAVDNVYIGGRIHEMRDGVERGETITRTASVAMLFPPLVLQMISVGEETGRVDDLLAEIADYYDREVDHALRNLSSAIEPIMIVAIGAIVLVLAMGVFLPMWNLASVSRG